MSAYNENSKEYTKKYVKDNYDEIKIRLPKGRKVEIQEHAKKQDESLNKFVSRAIDVTMELDTTKDDD